MNKILKIIFKAILYLTDLLLLLFTKGKSKNTESVLIIRLDAIGDFILWLDSARHFRKLYPGREITVLGNRVWTDLARKFPHWDEVWELDRRKFSRNIAYRLHILKKVRKAGFDVVVQPTYSREFSYGDAVARISGAREIIGSAGDDSNVIVPIEKQISDRYYTQLIPADPKPLMELQRNAELVRGLGYVFKPAVPDMMPVAQSINNPVADISPYFVLVPGALWTGRQWPVEKFSEFASLVFHETGMSAVTCGGVTERQLGEALTAAMDIPVINMVGETSLAELVAIIKDSQFLLGNETGAVHFAAAVSTPSFCILGGGHYGRFMPYDIDGKTEKPLPVPLIHKMNCFGCNWRCRYVIKDNEPAPCIGHISVEEVFRALQPLLKSRQQQGVFR